ncbi:MAG: hypothetical protein R3D66_06770 [Alphaproteobacteria bacterium]
MNIAFPAMPDGVWLGSFWVRWRRIKRFSIFCSGGDTTSIKGPLSISITAMGLVPAGKAVTRGGAKPETRCCLPGLSAAHFAACRLCRANPDLR